MKAKNTGDSALLLALEALADPVRLSIVRMLTKKTLCVCKIQGSLKMSQPRISRHLGLLKKAGLIACTKKGKWCYYRLTPGSIWESIRELSEGVGSGKDLIFCDSGCEKGDKNG